MVTIGKITRAFHPAQDEIGGWHCFISTRIGSDVRLAYFRADREYRYLDSTVSEDADRVAEWSLCPADVRAWRQQRAVGWDGTLDSVPEWFFAKA